MRQRDRIKRGELVHARATGAGTFPVDMLRYDSCWPSTSGDAAEVLGGMDAPRRTVRIARHAQDNGLRGWTADRWRSFGWTLELED